MASTTLKQQGTGAYQEKEKEIGGEEVVEVEKGVRVRKSGGVELAAPLSKAEIDIRQAEFQQQIEHQKTVIARAREEVLNMAKQANEQEILARESLELKEYNRKRQLEAGQEAKALLVEVTALIEKEKELETKRAAAHHAAIEKERERVQAKTAEVLAREEALEAEKREQFHNEMVRKCNALSLKFKLEEEQARLKMDSLQFSMQHGEFRSLSTAKKATIVVEVEPRDIPEARQFDTSPLERERASFEFGEEGQTAPVAESRSIEEIVSSESRTSHKLRSSTGILKEESPALESRGMQQEPKPVVENFVVEPTTIIPPSQAIPQQAAGSSVSTASAESAAQGPEAEKAAKKQKGGFFKKFGLGKHEQHQH